MNAGLIRRKDWWQGKEDTLRERLRQLIGAPEATDVALLHNTSEGLSVVAHGLDWRAGDNVVIPESEFPFNHIVWQSLASEGIEVREVVIADDMLNDGAGDGAGLGPEARLEQRCDENTRLIAVSSVQYGTGLRLDLARLGRFCWREGILLCVDAIQSLGVLPMDVGAMGIDFLAAGGHKWMLAPEGIGVFYCRRELRERLRLRQYGWHMMADPLDLENRDWRITDSNRRFECGSPNGLGILALNASLSLLLEVGMDKVAEGVLENAAFLMQAIAEDPRLTLLSPASALENPDRRSGIVTFGALDVPPRVLFEKLTAAGVVCAPRAGGIRFSPHFYTPLAQLERAMTLLREILPTTP